MIGAIFFVTSRGEVVLSRGFRDGFAIRNVSDLFRDEIIATKKVERCPVNVVDKIAFCHLRYDNLLLVAASRANVNCFLVFQYMVRLMQIIQDYYGKVDEMVLKENFIAIQEIVDETLDFGYPQVTEAGLLESYISSAGIKTATVTKTREAEKITIKATGKIPWRSDGIVYRDNEVFVDVVEEVNLLMSQSGEVLQREVVGRMVMRCFLSGMPECQMVLNDKTMVQQRVPSSALAAVPAPGTTTASPDTVELDDVTFHACVRLNAYDAEGAISFVPPDGEFVLMRYRSSGKVAPPLSVLFSRAKEVSKTRLEMDFHLQCNIDAQYHAAGVVVKIPCPANTANVKLRVAVGKAKYDPTEQAIVWKIKQMQGGTSTAFSAEVQMIAVTLASSERVWGRPPISINFTTEMYTASGLKVAQLRVTEPKMNYTPRKWIRYVSTGGQYQCRL